MVVGGGTGVLAGGGWVVPVRGGVSVAQGFSLCRHPKVPVLDSVEKVVLSVSRMLRRQPVTTSKCCLSST